MTYLVKDPTGLEHRLIHDGKDWHGYENLAHVIDEDEINRAIKRVGLTQDVLFAIGAGCKQAATRYGTYHIEKEAQ